MSMQTLTVGGLNLYEEFGVYIDTSLTFNKPKKDVEFINIPGRDDGALIVDYGTFQNIVLPVPCFIHGDFDTKFNGLINTLGAIRNYVPLRFSNDPDHTRQGYPLMTQAPTVKRINEDGWFDLQFNCKPYRYLRSGDRSVEIEYPSMQITNPTRFNALPRVHITGYGRLEINDSQIEIAQHPTGEIIIDSERMEIRGNLPYPYKASDYVTITTDVYPRFFPGGANMIYADATLTQGVTSARFYPNWREL